MPNRYRAVSRAVGGLETIELHDSEWPAKISIVPGIGNIAYEFLVRGTPVIWAPEGSPGKLKEKKSLAGIPFLAPWANRLESDVYRLGEGTHYIDSSMDNIRRDANGRPIHGLLLFAPWEVVSLDATESGASVTCQLDFAARPDFLRQFPIPHHYKMTHLLREGRLTVRLKVTNVSTEMLPLALGFHPYFALGRALRQRVAIKVPAKMRLELTDQMLPTGKALEWNGYSAFPLEDRAFDDSFVDLIRERGGTAVFEAYMGLKRLRVGFGPRFEVAVVYAPPGKQFVCFEPMTAIANAFNTESDELFAAFPKLQLVKPGDTWEESFWIELTEVFSAVPKFQLLDEPTWEESSGSDVMDIDLIRGGLAGGRAATAMRPTSAIVSEQVSLPSNWRKREMLNSRPQQAPSLTRSFESLSEHGRTD